MAGRTPYNQWAAATMLGRPTQPPPEYGGGAELSIADSIAGAVNGPRDAAYAPEPPQQSQPGRILDPNNPEHLALIRKYLEQGLRPDDAFAAAEKELLSRAGPTQAKASAKEREYWGLPAAGEARSHSKFAELDAAAAQQPAPGEQPHIPMGVQLLPSLGSMPGVGPGGAEAVGAYLEHGPMKLASSLKDVATGSGSVMGPTRWDSGREALQAGGITALPALPAALPAIAAAPGMFAAGIGTGLLGSAVAPKIAGALGAGEDQQKFWEEAGGWLDPSHVAALGGLGAKALLGKGLSLAAVAALPEGSFKKLWSKLAAGAEKKAALEAISTDEAMGVKFGDDEPSTFPDGSYAVVCTNCAEQIIKKVGHGEVYGWEEGTNPTSVIAGPERGAHADTGQGHDFAIIEGRYLVDPWAKNVEMDTERAAWDLHDPADRAEVRRLYGDPNTWVKRVDKNGEFSHWEPGAPAPMREGFEAARPSAQLSATSIREIFGKALFGDEKKWVSHLSAPEAQAVSGSAPLRDEFKRVRGLLPRVQTLVGAMLGGQDKRGWYEFSRQALKHVFGDDADLFAGLLAATSPQNSVEVNLQNATQIYAAWVNAGRPQERKKILKIMADNVVGDRGEDSVLQAWENNTVRALTGAPTLSGPKVDSFWLNLRDRFRATPHGDVSPEQAVTLDAWMANVFGISNKYFKGKKPTAKDLLNSNPGYSGGYLAGTSLMREAAAALDVLPAEAQEMAWSFGKVLYEMAQGSGKKGSITGGVKKTARQLVEEGYLTPDVIMATPDFHTLLRNKTYAGALDNVPGMSERLVALETTPPPIRKPMTTEQREWMLEAADNLDQLLAVRKTGTDLRTARSLPGRVMAVTTHEGGPSPSSGVDPDYFGKTRPQQVTVAGKRHDMSENLLGQGILAEEAAQGSTEVQKGVSQAADEAGKRTKQRSYGMTLREAATGGILPKDLAPATFASRAQAFALGQEQPRMTALRFVTTDEGKDAIRVALQNKLTDEQVARLVDALPEGVRMDHRRDHVDLLKTDRSPMTDTERDTIVATIRDMLPMKKGEEIDPTTGTPVMVPAKVRDVAGKNIAPDDRPLPWGEVGSRQVSEDLKLDYDKLTNAQKRRFDSDAVKTMFRRLAETYAKSKNARPDHLEVMQMIGRKGFSAWRAALKDPSKALPILAGLGLASQLLAVAQPGARSTGGRDQ